MDMEAESILTSSSVPTRGFHILHEKVLPYPARRGLAVWSPQLDLIAFVGTNENVYLYRMNGQRVWGVALRKEKLGSECIVERLQWRPDGKMLALGFDDGSTRIYDVNNGKQIHRITSEVPNFGSITCVGWVDNHSSFTSPNSLQDAKPTECTPQALLDLDVGQMLPRLSVLPSSSGPDSTFTSKTTLDALINAVTKGGEGSHLDVLLIGEENGKVLLNVFDSFLIGTLELSSLSHQLKSRSKLVRHTASPDLSTHSLLISESQSNRILFSTMDILFIQQFGQYLFQLASTSTRVQALLRYIRETIKALEIEFKTMHDLSQKYVNIIDEDVKKVGSEIGIEFFEFLVTGIPSVTLKEWLVDVLTERGQKRWEKSSTTGYETLRRLVHENLLPTCERLTVLFCRLRGLARWKERGSPLGLEPDDFTRCLDVVSGLTLFAHEFLSKLNKELDLFTAFASWLRYALDQLSTVINIDDKPADEPQIDTLKVAEYVGNYLEQSSLQKFFSRGSEGRLRGFADHGERIFELYSKKGTTEVPGFLDLAEYLEELCKTVFAKPQQAMRQQLRVGRPLVISTNALSISGIRMVSQAVDKSITYMALYLQKEASNCLIFVQCDITITGGLSTVSKVGCAKVTFSKERDQDLVDLDFVDDDLIMLVLVDQGQQTSEMVTMEYRTITYDKSYDISDSGQDIFSYANNLAGQDIIPVSKRAFDATFKPSQLTVNGRSGRRVGCIIAEDQMRYKVFDIDLEDEDEEEEIREESMEMDQETETYG